MKMPPKQKIYEAYSALADNRVEMQADTAIVCSSNHAKTYTVTFQGNVYTSTDNATYWQGYPGYPVLAVLMLEGKLSFPENLLPYLKNIDWHTLNDKFKRDYDRALQEALADLTEEVRQGILSAGEASYLELGQMELIIKRGRKK